MLAAGERLFAYLDDIYFVSRPERMGSLYVHRTHAGTQIHGVKTQNCNRAGDRPLVGDILERVAQAVNPAATVGRGSLLPLYQQGMKVLGTTRWDMRPEVVTLNEW